MNAAVVRSFQQPPRYEVFATPEPSGGNAGQMAVQIAKFLGAGHVVGAGRNPDRLSALAGLGADATVSLTGEPDQIAHALGSAAADVDVVIDYLWGPVTERAITAVVKARVESSQPLWWIQRGQLQEASG
jgi:NADPH-dependent curcumin reductase CurA